MHLVFVIMGMLTEVHEVFNKLQKHYTWLSALLLPYQDTFLGGGCVKREGRHFKNRCVLLGVLQESSLYLVQLSQVITLHCSIIFYLSESCQYYSVFPPMHCPKISFACHSCSLHVEQHSSISPTIKLCGEEPPSHANSQLECSLPLWNVGFFGMFTRACLDPVQAFMFFMIHFNVILSASRSHRMVYYPHTL